MFGLPWFFDFFSLELLCVSYLQFTRLSFYLRLAKLFNFYPYGKTWFQLNWFLSFPLLLSVMYVTQILLKNLYDFSYSVFNEHSLNFRQGRLAFTKLLRYLNLFKYLRRSVISPKELFRSSWAQVDSNHRPRAYQARALTSWAMSPYGDDGIRTHDPLLAGQVLSQLSYTPIWFFVALLFLLMNTVITHWKLNNNLLPNSYQDTFVFVSCSSP